MKLEDFQEVVEKLATRAKYGCGNHGCRIRPPTGQGTNGTCSCRPKEFARTFAFLAEELRENDWTK